MNTRRPDGDGSPYDCRRPWDFRRGVAVPRQVVHPRHAGGEQAATTTTSKSRSTSSSSNRATARASWYRGSWVPAPVPSSLARSQIQGSASKIRVLGQRVGSWTCRAASSLASASPVPSFGKVSKGRRQRVFASARVFSRYVRSIRPVGMAEALRTRVADVDQWWCQDRTRRPPKFSFQSSSRVHCVIHPRQWAKAGSAEAWAIRRGVGNL